MHQPCDMGLIHPPSTKEPVHLVAARPGLSICRTDGYAVACRDGRFPISDRWCVGFRYGRGIALDLRALIGLKQTLRPWRRRPA